MCVDIVRDARIDGARHHDLAPRRRRRGYSMVIVFMVLGVLTVGITSLLAYVSVSNQTKASAVARIRTFYACDGVQRLMGKVAADYLSTTGTPSKAGLFDALSAYGVSGSSLTLADIMPPGYVAKSIELKDMTSLGMTPVPVVYDGTSSEAILFARQIVVRTDVELRRGTLDYGCSVAQQISVSAISPLQFQIYDGLNENSTLGGGAFPLFLTGGFLSTSAVRVRAGEGVFIRGFKRTGVALAALAPGEMPHGPVFVQKERSAAGVFGNGTIALGTPLKTTTSCSDPVTTTGRLPGAPPSSPEWLGSSSDCTSSGQHVMALPIDSPIPQDPRLPGFGEEEKPSNADHSGANNEQTQRFLIEPVRPGDTAVKRTRMLAAQSDLRIIDGVWYLRDPSNPELWPGTPIWSDHPGTFSRGDPDFPSGVGVDDVGTWPAAPPMLSSRSVGNPTGTVPWEGAPRRYSWYAAPAGVTPTASAGWMLPPLMPGAGEAPLAVVSYGAVCAHGSLHVPCGYSGGPVRARAFLDAARVGFRDAIWEDARRKASASLSGINSADVLPLNFDVQAFVAALRSTDEAELGTHFSSSRPFNGIVWISQTWPDAWRNDSTAPPSWASTTQTTTQPPVAPPLVSGSLSPQSLNLPYPLCTSSPIPAAPNNTYAPGAGGIKVTNCSDTMNRPNAVRLINGGDIDPADLPRGLTIATNLPLYILGDLNAKSVPDDSPFADAGSGRLRYRSWGVLKNIELGASDATQFGHVLASTTWTPMMVAGDTVTVLSKNWLDQDWPWGADLAAVAGAHTSPLPRADDVTIIASIITGVKRATADTDHLGLTGALRTLERWSDSATNEYAAVRVRGSLLVGFYPVFSPGSTAFGLNVADVAHSAAGADRYRPFLDFVYDEHLDSNTPGLPPGAPMFSFTFTRTWQRR